VRDNFAERQPVNRGSDERKNPRNKKPPHRTPTNKEKERSSKSPQKGEGGGESAKGLNADNAGKLNFHEGSSIKQKEKEGSSRYEGLIP